MYNKKILVDLDGVLNEYNGNYDANYIPPKKEGAEKFLEELNKDADLYLFTTRDTQLAQKWLLEYNLDKFFKDVTNIKISCFLHIDDRAVCFNGNYAETLNDVKNFRAYWK